MALFEMFDCPKLKKKINFCVIGFNKGRPIPCKLWKKGIGCTHKQSKVRQIKMKDFNSLRQSGGN